MTAHYSAVLMDMMVAQTADVSADEREVYSVDWKVAGPAVYLASDWAE